MTAAGATTAAGAPGDPAATPTAAARPPLAGRLLRRGAPVVAGGAALGLAVALAAASAVLVAGRLPEGDEGTLVGPALVGATCAALSFGPLRAAATAAASRALRGARPATAEVVRAFGERASRAVEVEELLRQLAESLRASLDLARAEVWVAGGGHVELAVSVPDRDPATLTLGPVEADALAGSGVVGRSWASLWVPTLLDERGPGSLRIVPARFAGAVLGLVVVERRAGAAGFDAADDAALVELGRRLGVVLHNRQLDAALQTTLDDLRRANDDLRASRARLVATADAERRRLERDLHDGAQQHLVALAVNLRLLRDVVADDPAEAATLVDELHDEVRATIQQLRDLAHGIYPSLLVDAGLGDALRAAAARSPLPVTAAVDDVGRHGAEVETAVYFCCLEALQNAAKHAPGAAVRLVVRLADGELRFEVADDGPGFDPGAAGVGHGLQNMADRIGAVGGTLAWDTAVGAGTAVRGAVPVGTP